MSKITNDGLTRSDTGRFIAVPIWHSGRQRVNGSLAPCGHESTTLISNSYTTLQPRPVILSASIRPTGAGGKIDHTPSRVGCPPCMTANGSVGDGFRWLTASSRQLIANDQRQNPIQFVEPTTYVGVRELTTSDVRVASGATVMALDLHSHTQRQ